MSKSVLCSILFLLICTISRGETLLVINFKDKLRPNETYILEDMPKISFDSNRSILFNIGDEVTSYSYDEIRSYSFDNVTW